MAIYSFDTQPVSQSLHAMMRPIIVKVLTDVVVPIVYCDVYINDTYKGTFSATAYEQKLTGALRWRFDIRSKIQEFFDAPVPASFNTGNVQKGNSSCRVFVKVRDSITQNGVVVPEGPEPVMAIGDELAIPGGGEKSNEFFVFRATLQHEDNQNFDAHLSNYRKGEWAMDAWPLTHRPNGYQVLPGRPDSFPFATTGEHAFSKIRITYRRINRVTWESAEAALEQAPEVCGATIVSLNISTNPNGSANVTYQLSGADELYWSHPGVAGGAVQGPEDSGSFMIPAMLPGSYDVEFSPKCSNDQYGPTLIRRYEVSSRPSLWRPRVSDAYCQQSSGDNTGYLVYQTLEQVYTDVTPNALTGQTKPNTPTDPDFVPPVYNTISCPVPPPANTGREIFGAVMVYSVDICGALMNSFYIDPRFLNAAIGVHLFTDQSLSVEVVGYSYFKADDGTVYQLSGNLINSLSPVQC